MIKKKKHKFPLTRSEIMSRVKSQNTSIEKKLRKEIWNRGLRYTKNDKSIFGTPDIAFKRKKIAIFCDSKFWHGRDFSEENFVVKTNRDYWLNKIKRNMKRDMLVNEKLKSEDWTVLRFWEEDIGKDTESCIEKIEKAYRVR